MQNLTTLQASSNQFMSSKEIADLTGKQHSNVLRDIRSMFDGLGDSNLNHEQYQVVKDERNYTAEVKLNHDLTVLLLTGYDVKARLAVIKRWKELEAQQAPKLPQTMAQALRLAAEQAEQIEQQQAALAIAQPKAQAYDVIADASVGHMNITSASKVLKMQPKKLFAYLEQKGWIYKSGGKWIGKQSAIETGYVTMVAATANNTGEPVLRASVHLTDKGVAKISAMLVEAKKITELLN